VVRAKRSKFLILHYYIPKISLSSGGRFSHPIKFEVRALLCFFLFKKGDEIIFLGVVCNYFIRVNIQRFIKAKKLKSLWQEIKT